MFLRSLFPAGSHSKSSNERKREVGSSSSSSSSLLPPAKKIRVQEPSSSSASSSTSNSPLMGTPTKIPTPPIIPKLFTPLKLKRDVEEVSMEFEGQNMTGDYFLQTFEKAEKADDSEAVQVCFAAALNLLRYTLEYLVT